MRVLSPKIEPPERAEDGSTAKTASRRPSRSTACVPNASMNVDLPDRPRAETREGPTASKIRAKGRTHSRRSGDSDAKRRVEPFSWQSRLEARQQCVGLRLVVGARRLDLVGAVRFTRRWPLRSRHSPSVMAFASARRSPRATPSLSSSVDGHSVVLLDKNRRRRQVDRKKDMAVEGG